MNQFIMNHFFQIILTLCGGSVWYFVILLVKFGFNRYKKKKELRTFLRAYFENKGESIGKFNKRFLPEAVINEEYKFIESHYEEYFKLFLKGFKRGSNIK